MNSLLGLAVGVVVGLLLHLVTRVWDINYKVNALYNKEFSK